MGLKRAAREVVTVTECTRRCQHTSTAGHNCGKPLDEAHSLHRLAGGFTIQRHRAVGRALAGIVDATTEAKVNFEQATPRLGKEINGEMRRARLDVVYHEPGGK